MPLRLRSFRPRSERRRTGLILALSVIASYLAWSVTVSERWQDLLVWRNAVLCGLLGGAAIIGIGAFVRYGQWMRNMALQLRHLGLAGVWTERPNCREFSDELCRSIARSRSLDAVGADGLTLLSLLADPRGARLERPRPELKGARIRLLLVPPRSHTIDPERGRRSCAEEVLARLSRSPEEHWRHVQEALEVRNRWVAEHEISIDIRFNESRPAFGQLMVGKRAWYRAWEGVEAPWMEVRDSRAHPMVRALDDHFVGAWAHASREFSFALAAGPTGSTFIRKGVSLPTIEELHLTA